MSKPSSVRWDMLWRRWIRPAVVVAAFVSILRSACLDWNYVFSNSMSPTIHAGDCILVNKLAFGLRVPLGVWRSLSWATPERGDIVLFHAPDDNEPLVKRIVGLPGDRIEIRDNRLFINGELIAVDSDTSLGTRRTARSDGDRHFTREKLGAKVHEVVFCADRRAQQSTAPVVVSPGQYFVLGDNRDESIDSRAFGPVSRDQIIGRVIGVTFALNPAKHFVPAWGRCFRGVL